MPETLMSQTSTMSSTSSTKGRQSRSSCVPGSPMNMSQDMRTAIAVSWPTASFTCSIVSRQKRARVTQEPAESAARALGRIDGHLLDGADVVLVHLLRIGQVLEVAWDLRWRTRDAPRLHARS